MAQPSREEIIAYIQQLSQQYGIDPEVFKTIVNGESGFNPGAVGDQGQSFGLAQLYMGGGLGNVYEQQYGTRPDNPDDWKQQLDFMAKQAVSGGKGWEPWHASARLGIEPNAGLPGGTPHTPGAPGRRDRDVAPTAPGTQPAGQQPTQEDNGLLEAFRKYNEPKKTLAGWALRKTGLLPQDSKSATLGEALFKGMGVVEDPEKKAIAEAATEGYNSAAPMSKADQVAQLTAKKAKKLGPSLVSMFTGQQPAQTNPLAPKKTLGSAAFTSLFGPNGLFG